MNKSNAIKLARRSVELNWLSKYNKTITLPELVIVDQSFVNNVEVGGYMTRPCIGETYINGKYYDLKHGIMVITTHDSDDSIIHEVISHEWRHHVQHMCMKNIEKPQQWIIHPAESYKDAIIRYFNTSITEMDALLYSLHKSPSSVNCQWYQWLIEANKLEHIKGIG